jgi:hypothetical protein
MEAELKLENLMRGQTIIAQVLAYIFEQGFDTEQLHAGTLGLSEEDNRTFDSTVTWLIDEGIIRVANISHPMVGGITLLRPVITAHGFSILGQPLTIGGAQSTVADGVVQASKGKLDYSALGDFVGGLLGGFTKSVGS